LSCENSCSTVYNTIYNLTYKMETLRRMLPITMFVYPYVCTHVLGINNESSKMNIHP